MRLTRGQFLRAAGVGAAGLVVPAQPAGAAAEPRGLGQALSADSPPFMTFYSRRDLRPPKVSLTRSAAASDEGFLFLGPSHKDGAQAGAMIVDSAGRLVWFQPVPQGSWVTNFGVQRYRGGPALVWWEGVVNRASGYGRGGGVILDGSYRQLARIWAGNGRHADLHELLVTPQGTALITCYPEVVPADLSAVGGARDGRVYQSVVQEIDIRTGRLVFEWRSLEHVDVAESYCPVWDVFDYLHVNSIDLTPDGHLLLSARHTCAVYKVHRRTGRVLWRLGGRRSDFEMGRGTRFAWQHDARVHPSNRISLFDDGAGVRKTEGQSRGILLDVDEARHRVSLVRAYRHSRPLLAYAMGNMQLLPDGNVVLGWGNVPVLSEFGSGGSLLGEVRLPWGHASYRAFRYPWSASPTGAPSLAAAATGNATTLYASWNGATGVATWQTALGPSPSTLSPGALTPRTGFETAIRVPVTDGYASVVALDDEARPLGQSAVIRL
jgi:Arylsulfotransferase (ASST)